MMPFDYKIVNPFFNAASKRLSCARLGRSGAEAAIEASENIENQPNI
jgi:hypothetical protein